MQEEFLRNKDVISILLSIAVMIVIGAYFAYGAITKVRDDSVGEVLSVSSQGFEDVKDDEQARLNQMVSDVYTSSHEEAISGVGDPQFTEFYRSTINPKCPFYEPDGASYRGCLLDWESALRDGFHDKAAEKKITDYCLSISDQYDAGLEATELNLECLIYKLTSASA